MQCRDSLIDELERLDRRFAPRAERVREVFIEADALLWRSVAEAMRRRDDLFVGRLMRLAVEFNSVGEAPHAASAPLGDGGEQQ